MLGHKTSVNFKKIETIPNIFSNNNGMTLEMNYNKKTGKNTNMQILNNMLLHNYWVKNRDKIHKEIKRTLILQCNY